jgi:S1-C subfamily serine protease
MSEHDEEEPPPGRWRLSANRRGPVEGAEPWAPPDPNAASSVPGGPIGATWTSPGAGRPYPGESHSADPTAESWPPSPPTSESTAWSPAPPSTAAPSWPRSTPPPSARPATPFSYPYPGGAASPASPAAPTSPYASPVQPTSPYASPAQPTSPYASPAQPTSPYPSPVQPTSPYASPAQPSSTYPNANQPTTPYASPASPGAVSPPPYPNYGVFPDYSGTPASPPYDSAPSTPPPFQGTPNYDYSGYSSYGPPTYPGPLTSPDSAPAPAYPGAPGYAGYGGTPGWSGGSWQPPPTDYGSWGPAPQPGWGPPAAPASSGRKGSFAIILVAIIVAAVVGLEIGGQLVTQHSAAGQAPTFFPTQPTIGNGGSSGSGGGMTAAQAAAIASAVDPSVVDIDTKLGYEEAAAAGTGMVLTSDGEVLTNNHVVAGATSLSATVVGGKTYDVKVLGTDPTDDVALVKLVGASGLTPIKIGNPSQLTPGDPIVAVGNAGGVGGTPSVVTGVVEALDQQVTASDTGGGNTEQLSGLIQINAPLQPGDSGGPLLTAAGQVVGMDTAASSSNRFEGQQSVGFAIPISHATSITQQIAAGHGSATIVIGLPGFLGVSVPPTSAPGAPAGAAISEVIPGTPAVKSGLAAGDVITAIDGQTVDAPKDLTAILQQHHAGDKVIVTWLDPSGKSHMATVTLITGPAA